jgi:ribosomal-protein-alanine N-acetyltransferase
MQKIEKIETERLILRSWRADDAEVLFEINNDSKVIEFLPKALTRQECQNFINKENAQIAQKGFGLWACELKKTNELIGFVGLGIPNFESHFTPCVEIGWRLSFKHWGNGYATEAAKMALKIGFENFNLKEIVSFTTAQNAASIAVMQKIGMTRDKNGDFNHPKLPANHRLSRHVLYYCYKNSSSSTKLGLFW